MTTNLFPILISQPSFSLLCLKSHEALQSLVVTICGQPCIGFVGYIWHDEAAWCFPLTWCLTDRMFTQVNPKGYLFNLTLSCIDKNVLCGDGCMLWDSESEDKLCLPAAVTVSLNLCNKVKQKNRTDLNQWVCHLVWPFHQSALIGLQSVSHAFHSWFPHWSTTYCKTVLLACGWTIWEQATHHDLNHMTKSHHQKYMWLKLNHYIILTDQAKKCSADNVLYFDKPVLTGQCQTNKLCLPDNVLVIEAVAHHTQSFLCHWVHHSTLPCCMLLGHRQQPFPLLHNVPLKDTQFTFSEVAWQACVGFQELLTGGGLGLQGGQHSLQVQWWFTTHWSHHCLVTNQYNNSDLN